MDFSKFSQAQEHGAVLELKDPTGQPLLTGDGLPVTITLAGLDSARWRKAENAIGDKRLKAANGYKSWADQVDDRMFLLASATIAWSGVGDDGEELECNVVNAKKIYLKPSWVRTQVDAFIGDQSNFMPASSKS